MNSDSMPKGCSCCSLSRRRFLAKSCTACVAGAGLLGATARARAADNPRRTKIRIIYSLHAAKQPGPDWPNVGFDFQPVMDRITRELSRGCPTLEFVTSLADGEAVAKKILEEDKSSKIDGYLVYQMNAWNRVIQTIVGSGKPTLYADFQYGGSGGFLVYTAGFLRAKAPNLGFVASSKIEDVVAAAACFELLSKGGSTADFVNATQAARLKRTPAPGDMTSKQDRVAALSPKDCLARMKESKILVFEEGWPAIHSEVQQEMGIAVVKLPFKELNAAWEAADKDQSREIAARW